MITFFIVWFALSVPAIYFYEKVVGQQNIFTLFCHVVMAPLSIITTLLFVIFSNDRLRKCRFRIFK